MHETVTLVMVALPLDTNKLKNWLHVVLTFVIVTLAAVTVMHPVTSLSAYTWPGVLRVTFPVTGVRVPVVPVLVASGYPHADGTGMHPTGGGAVVVGGGVVVAGGVVAGGVVGGTVVGVGVGVTVGVTVGVGEGGGVAVGDPDGLTVGGVNACTHVRSHVLSALVRPGYVNAPRHSSATDRFAPSATVTGVRAWNNKKAPAAMARAMMVGVRLLRLRCMVPPWCGPRAIWTVRSRGGV